MSPTDRDDIIVAILIYVNNVSSVVILLGNIDQLFSGISIDSTIGPYNYYACQRCVGPSVLGYYGVGVGSQLDIPGFKSDWENICYKSFCPFSTSWERFSRRVFLLKSSGVGSRPAMSRIASHL